MITKKEPITPDILKKIVCTYCNTHCNLKDLRIASMCLLCYSGFLRFSELVNLRRSDITFFPTYIKLFLVKSKTDVYREGRDVLIAKTGLPTCPVNMLNRYLNLASIENKSQEFIFSLYICLNLKMCTNYESLVNFHIQGLEKCHCPLLRVLD
jgi:integrase